MNLCHFCSAGQHQRTRTCDAGRKGHLGSVGNIIFLSHRPINSLVAFFKPVSACVAPINLTHQEFSLSVLKSCLGEYCMSVFLSRNNIAIMGLYNGPDGNHPVL